MGLLDDHEPNATPKLSLSKLPNKHMMRGEPLLMPTPPCKLSASVPFQWEEAPGKPRSSSSSIPSTKNNNSRNSTFTTTARRLDLPPRLLLINHSNSIDSSSSSSSSSLSSASSKFGSANFYFPTAVLDGPDHECSQSFPLQKGYSVRSLKEEIIRDEKIKEHDWPALSESFGLSSSARSSSSKLPRFKRRSSFASLSHASSSFFTGIYGSFKQVVQWRRREAQKK